MLIQSALSPLPLSLVSWLTRLIGIAENEHKGIRHLSLYRDVPEQPMPLEAV
jgi:hypothetical protein